MGLLMKIKIDALHFSIGLLFCGMLICMAEAKVHYHDFILKDKNFTRLCVTKSMLVVNEEFPGPTLYVRRGDTMFVNVQNQGNYGVTIHWHGVYQPRNPWSDGPEYITQCAIEPGKNFTYEVIFTTEEGTLWWHAHNVWTRNTVHGAIVIYPAEGSTTPYPTSFGEQILILGSWYDYDVNLVVEKDLIIGEEMPASSSYLINGQPGDFSPCSQDTTFRWSVEYNKTYLLRIVSATMNAELFFAIAQHNLTVVGMDGEYLKPFVSSYIMISPGQTIDVLVTTNQISSEGQYYMAARQFLSTRQNGYTYDSTNVTAILEYNNNKSNIENGVDPILPDTLPSYTDLFAGFSFINQSRSLANEAYPINVPANITTRMFITIAMNTITYFYDGDNSSAGIGSSLNNISWSDPEIDILQAYYRNISGVFADDFPDEPPNYFDFTAYDMEGIGTSATKGTRVKVLNYNEQVEIVAQGTNVMVAENHPMHLHGHSVYRVGIGRGNFDPLYDPTTYNLIDPPAGSTFTVPGNGWITIRFRANNPGVWLWHCHFDRHFSWGMNTVFIVKNGGTPESTMRDPPPNMPSCPISSTLGVNGRESHNYLRNIE